MVKNVLIFVLIPILLTNRGPKKFALEATRLFAVVVIADTFEEAVILDV